VKPILINQKDVFGILPKQRSISGFQIQPFVCFIDNIQNIKLNQSEVKHIFTIPLDWILDHRNWGFETYKLPDGKERQVVVFNKYENEIVWGITGQILVSLSDLLLWKKK
jgi:hypothetical protein